MPKAAPLVTAAPQARNHHSWGRNTFSNRRDKSPIALRYLRHPQICCCSCNYWSHQIEIPDGCSYGIHFRPHELTGTHCQGHRPVSPPDTVGEHVG